MAATRFADRRAAGQALGERLRATHARRSDAVVLGLPRGGVLVAAGVAAALAAPLDVLVVRKLGLPWQPELAMGAIAAVGDTVETVRVGTVLAAARVDPETFETVRQQELVELRRRESAYRDGRPPVAVGGPNGDRRGRRPRHRRHHAAPRSSPSGVRPREPSPPPSRRVAVRLLGAGGRRRRAWSASRPRTGSARSARPTRTSPRPRTPRSVPPSRRPRARRPDGGPGRSAGGPRGPAVPCLTRGPRLGNRTPCEPVHKLGSRVRGGPGGGADVGGATTGCHGSATVPSASGFAWCTCC